MKTVPAIYPEWLDAIFAVNFHVDHGQEIEEIFTFDDKLEFDTEMLNHVKYHAFPDINMQEMTNMIYCFTYEDYYIYNFFTQQKQANVKRGALQKSLCICTKLKYTWFGMFRGILSCIGPLFIEMGHQIILDCLKTLGQTPLNERILLFGSMIINQCNVLTMFTPQDMVTLWELLITGNGLVVFGKFPSDCTIMSFGCLQLLDPLELDIIPYYTIHSRDLKEHQQYQNKVIAVANPFLVKQLNWPNMLNHEGLQSSHKCVFNIPPITVEDEFTLKTFFYDLNEKFVQPIKSFINLLLPNMAILMKHVHLKSFQIPEFLKNLESAYIPLSKEFHIKRQDMIQIYEKFVKTAMFTRYLSSQVESTECLLRFRYLELLASFNLLEWASKKNELEIVELLIKIRELVTQFDPLKYTVEERKRTSSAPPVMYKSFSDRPESPLFSLQSSPEGDITVQSTKEPLQKELRQLLKQLKQQTDKLIKLVPSELHESLPKIPFDNWI
eukprot:NODE_170_length_14437_cov_1.447273.p2 type:complete len:497 gc:universal NODE_170_length_14437_cov_1.447273:6989-8479(+)